MFTFTNNPKHFHRIKWSNTPLKWMNLGLGSNWLVFDWSVIKEIVLDISDYKGESGKYKNIIQIP